MSIDVAAAVGTADTTVDEFMDGTPQSAESGDTAALELYDAVPEGWILEHEATAEAERLERLAVDQELVDRVRLEGFGGTTWRLLSEALVAYGTQVIRPWVRTGRIFPHCREKGFKVKEPPPSGMASFDVADLADETVAFAITRFQNEVLATGRWDPTRGASLKTFFIGMCLKQFPTTYTEWLRRAGREAEEQRALRDRACHGGDWGTPWRPAAIAVSMEETLEALVPDELTRAVVQMRHEGYHQAEISEVLGISEGAVESRLHRLRSRWRTQGDEQA